MATYQVLYWKDIPTQVKASEGADDETVTLGPWFEEKIDEVATELGLVGSDAYIDQYEWSDEEDRDGSAKEVAEAVAAELIAKHKK